MIPFALLGGILLNSCGSGSTAGAIQPTLKGARTFAIDVKEGSGETYDAAFTIAQNLGVSDVQLSMDWDLIETSAGFDFTIPDIAELYYPKKQMPVTLVFRPIDTGRRTVPSDLTSKAFDDAQMISRFQAFLTAIKGRLKKTQVARIEIGNEVDAWLGTDKTKWASWTTFYRQVSATAHTLWGASMPVGCTVQYTGLTQPSTSDLAKTLNSYTDFVAVNYYPLNPNFTVRPTTVIDSDFQILVNHYPTRPIVFQECGYPSSAACMSTPDAQSAFITAVFRAWDKHAKAIVHIDFAWLTDVSSTTLDQWVVTYGMTGNPSLPAFRGYLGSLGLRDPMGKAKPALTQLSTELSRRAW